eukprot:9495843-Pyramimonas_sp.AAC.1
MAPRARNRNRCCHDARRSGPVVVVGAMAGGRVRPARPARPGAPVRHAGPAGPAGPAVQASRKPFQKPRRSLS